MKTLRVVINCKMGVAIISDIELLTKEERAKLDIAISDMFVMLREETLISINICDDTRKKLFLLAIELLSHDFDVVF